MAGKFLPEYPGDNPNRKWVRDRAREKGLDMPATEREAATRILFWQIVSNLELTEEEA